MVISHNTLIGSNHQPLTIQFAQVVALGPSHFSLEAFWLRDSKFLSVLANNLSHFSRMLSTWSKKFSNNGITINKLLKVLKGNDFQPHAGTKCEVHLTTTRKLGEVWRNEKEYWLQRLHINWLCDGDKNTVFFHHSTIQHRQKNRILKLKDSDKV
ncbi:hypothetical protein ACFXTO_025203 [Malus domestica]